MTNGFAKSSTVALQDAIFNFADQNRGSASQRPTIGKGLISGHQFFNLSDNRPEWYNGESWVSLRTYSTTVPSSSTSTGLVGDYAADTSYLYICVSNNNWRRVPLAAW
jgi:hypothetical protein